MKTVPIKGLSIDMEAQKEITIKRQDTVENQGRE